MTNPAIVADLTNAGLAVGNGGGEVPVNVAQHRLDQAWRALQAEPDTRNVVTWIETQQVAAETVADVVAAAALRVLRNPDGREQEANALDDFTESWKSADATQDFYFTAAELRRLRPADPFVGGWSGSLPYSR